MMKVFFAQFSLEAKKAECSLRCKII